MQEISVYFMLVCCLGSLLSIVVNMQKQISIRQSFNFFLWQFIDMDLTNAQSTGGMKSTIQALAKLSPIAALVDMQFSQTRR